MTRHKKSSGYLNLYFIKFNVWRLYLVLGTIHTWVSMRYRTLEKNLPPVFLSKTIAMWFPRGGRSGSFFSLLSPPMRIRLIEVCMCWDFLHWYNKYIALVIGHMQSVQTISRCHRMVGVVKSHSNLTYTLVVILKRSLYETGHVTALHNTGIS